MAYSEIRAGGEYDAIVVGAGIAGMMAATDLNWRGHKVLVLEHNHQPGGLMSGIWRKGFYFDVGCQSFENMGIVFPLLEQYGLSEVASFHRARYRLMMPGGLDTIVMSLKETREAFKRAYPESAKGFDKAFDTHDSVSELCKKMFVPEAIPYVRKETPTAFAGWLSKALPWAGQLKKLMFDDFEDWYKTVLPPSAARDLLSRCGYTRMNVFVASAFWHLWANDYWYPNGGYQKWFDTWQAALEKRGVKFQFKSAVTSLDKEGDLVRAVFDKNGNRYSAREVIFAGDYKFAMRNLIGFENYSDSMLKKMESVKHSDPLVCVYLGLDLPIEKLRKILKSSHIFYFPNEKCTTEMALDDNDAHKKVFLEVTAHCLEDTSLAPEGKSCLVLQAFTRCEWNDHWISGDEWSKRSIEYKELKRKVTDEIIGVFEGVFPEVRKHIEYSDIGTPLSAYRFTKNYLGGSCGFELNWRNYPFLNPLAQTKTPLKNFHMAGHFTVWPGAVPTAALSGKIASLRAHQALKSSGKTRGRFQETQPEASL